MSGGVTGACPAVTPPLIIRTGAGRYTSSTATAVPPPTP